MGSFDNRSKKKIQVWKKALFHFSLCFVMGFFTGFAPTNAPSIFSSADASVSYQYSPAEQPVASSSSIIVEDAAESVGAGGHLNRSIIETSSQEEEDEKELILRKQLIIITPTRLGDRFQGAFLTRLGNTLKLVAPPVLWIVVETHSDSSETTEILRKTGIMYRHLVINVNYTDERVDTDHQRNVALNHIEHHHLDGIVHFAGVYNVYDLQFFENIRNTGVFGTWPIALMSPNRKNVVVEGPVCTSSQVVGWHLKNSNDEWRSRPYIPVSSFAFNSSVLWDPERWGRASSTQDSSQESLEFVKQVVLEDETKLMGIPEGCSKVMLWHLRVGVPRLHQITILGKE
ncbi:hypothetical protein MRB53_029486 [Persea americana]|uniref:Uncharacterized protein n=1 Tax=Persea americana TaxID=3435 RepID=A0ACC2KJL6_PERAE|nr:hypothetical protein MRB53_029486 [Persea americana]